MEALKKFLNNSQTSSILGIVLLLTAFFDMNDITFLVFKLKLGIGIFFLALYHILRSVAYLVESED